MYRWEGIEAARELESKHGIHCVSSITHPFALNTYHHSHQQSHNSKHYFHHHPSAILSYITYCPMHSLAFCTATEFDAAVQLCTSRSLCRSWRHTNFALRGPDHGLAQGKEPYWGLCQRERPWYVCFFSSLTLVPSPFCLSSFEQPCGCHFTMWLAYCMLIVIVSLSYTSGTQAFRA